MPVSEVNAGTTGDADLLPVPPHRRLLGGAAPGTLRPWRLLLGAGVESNAQGITQERGRESTEESIAEHSRRHDMFPMLAAA